MVGLRSMSRIIVSSLLALFCLSLSVFAISHDEAMDLANHLYQRLTGIPPSQVILDQMTNDIMAGHVDKAALVAIDSSDLGFYKNTLVGMFTPLSNEDHDPQRPLSDFTATVVGLIINNKPFNQALYANVIYTPTDDLQTYFFKDPNNNNQITSIHYNGNPLTRISNTTGFLDEFGNRLDVPKVRAVLRTNGLSGDRRYEDNITYLDLQNNVPDWPREMVARSQTEVFSQLRSGRQVQAEDVAGLITSREMANANFSAGTNRVTIKNIASDFFCKDLTQLQDATAADDFVRRDVDRSPNGDSRVYQNTCRSCHAGMDGLANAFSYFDFQTNHFAYDPHALDATITDRDLQGVNGPRKIFRAFDNYPAGYRPVDNTWSNRWTTGPNASLGWRTPPSGQSVNHGKGAAQLGEVLAYTKAFSDCMATRVFKRTCLRDPTPNEATQLISIARQFEQGFSAYASYDASGKYNMRALFAQVAPMCFGGEN